MQKQRFLLIALLATASPALADNPSGAPGGSIEVKKEAPTRFYGFGLDFTMWDSTGLNAVNYSNSMAFLFEPSWNLGKVFFPGTRFSRLAIAGRWLINREFAGYDEAQYSQYSNNGYAVRCSNLTPSTNGGTVDPNAVNRCQYDSAYRTDQGDIWLTVKNPKIVTIPYAQININPSIRFVLPASAESRYQTMYFSMSPAIGANRSFFDGKLTVGYSFLFTKYFNQYTTPGQATDGAPLRDTLVSNNLQFADIAPTNANFLTDPSHVGTIGGYNPNYGFMHIFAVDVAPTDKLSISALYLLIDTFAYAAQCQYTVNGQPYDLCTAGDQVAQNSGSNILRVGHKDSQVLWITVGYQVLDWLNINAAWINWAPQRKPDGSLRQPFISTNYDAFTSISLGATVTIEKAAAKIF